MTQLGSQPPDQGTRLAVDRTRLAYERTMMAWVRTSTSLISFGFTIHKFFEYRVQQGAVPSDRLIGPPEFGGIMIATGLLALVIASVDHRRNMKALAASYGPMPRSLAAAVGILITTLGGLALAGVLFRL
jgi:putative membrane protein